VSPNLFLVGVCINLFFRRPPGSGRQVEDCGGSLTAGGLFVRSESHIMFCFRHVLV
jgi:hypothetical protein